MPDYLYNYSEVASKIRSVRMKKKITKEEMAEHLRIMKPRYSRIEGGKIEPTIYQLLVICTVLEVTPNDLFIERRRD